MRGLRVLALLAGGLSIGSCAQKLVAVRPDPVLLSQAQPLEAVRAAVVRALAAQRLLTETEQSGRVVARHDRRGLVMRLMVDYSDRQYVVRYLDSCGVAQPGPQGETMLDARCARIIHRLQRAVRDEIDRPAREAAAAAASARQHELAVEAERRRAAEAAAEAERLRNQPPPPPVVEEPPAPPPHPYGGGGGVVIDRRVQHRDVQQSLTCCINGAYYSCPDQDAFNHCVGLKPSRCTRDRHQDGRCRR